VVLDLGGGRYALYAHLQPGSLTVVAGDRVRRGQVLGKVGNTGNSVAPHLHFHVMDGPSPLDANGLPYRIDRFEVTGHAASTAAFDEAEAKGTPLAMTAATPPLRVQRRLPMDLSIVSFPR
jgi:murein DD-endopeptidase MepM/ murein hydrolase activator NlpD